jgi:renalase
MLRDCVIIGGGISGLIAAKTLDNQGMKVTILDKGRGIGGRLATRRLNYGNSQEGIIDYGAPHFTAQSPTFQTMVEEWLELGLVKVWSTGFNIDNKNYYCGVENNRAIAKYLARDLDVHTSTKVTHLEWRDSYWQVYTETGTTFTGTKLLLTPPVPQTLALLDNSDILLEPEIREKLNKVSYHPCIAVLALFSQPNLIPAPGGLGLKGNPLKWISCNHQKGISPYGYGVTLYASREYSQTHWDSADETIVQDLLTSAATWLKSEILTYQVHRWRYSQAEQVYGEPYLAITQPGILVLAGDGFLNFHLEGAALSGLAAGNYLKSEYP